MATTPADVAENQRSVLLSLAQPLPRPSSSSSSSSLFAHVFALLLRAPGTMT